MLKEVPLQFYKLLRSYIVFLTWSRIHENLKKKLAKALKTNTMKFIRMFLNAILEKKKF